MKDERLEQQFDEYFKGVNTPDNLTDDAKKYVVKKQPVLPKIVKFASVAASFVLVFAAALALVLHGGLFNTKNKVDNGASLPPSSSNYTAYGDDELEYSYIDAYSVNKLDNSLTFVKNLAIANNADVSGLKAGYMDGGLALVTADLSLIGGMSRHDTKIYVEFTEDSLVYGELKEYYDGSQYYYNGTPYYLTSGVADNGEPETKLSFSFNGVKYYFNVTSANENAHFAYLKMIIK